MPKLHDYRTIEIMEPIKILSEAEVRTIYRQGEDAIVKLIQSMNQKLLVLTERVQALEDRLAKNSRNSGKPPPVMD